MTHTSAQSVHLDATDKGGLLRRFWRYLVDRPLV
jgi:hypothetical protein